MPYINKLKNGNYPKSPETVEEIIEAFEENGTGSSFSEFHMGTHVGDDFSFSVFCSKKMLRRINETIPEKREILMDATFKAVPVGPYKQLLILYVAYDSTVITNTYRWGWKKLMLNI